MLAKGKGKVFLIKTGPRQEIRLFRDEGQRVTFLLKIFGY